MSILVTSLLPSKAKCVVLGFCCWVVFFRHCATRLLHVCTDRKWLCPTHLKERLWLIRLLIIMMMIMVMMILMISFSSFHRNDGSCSTLTYYLFIRCWVNILQQKVCWEPHYTTSLINPSTTAAVWNWIIWKMFIATAHIKDCISCLLYCNT